MSNIDLPFDGVQELHQLRILPDIIGIGELSFLFSPLPVSFNILESIEFQAMYLDSDGNETPANYNPKHVPVRLFGYTYRPYVFRARRDNVVHSTIKYKHKSRRMQREELDEPVDPAAEGNRRQCSSRPLKRASRNWHPRIAVRNGLNTPAPRSEPLPEPRSMMREEPKTTPRRKKRRTENQSSTKKSHGIRFYNLRSSPWRKPNRNMKTDINHVTLPRLSFSTTKNINEHKINNNSRSEYKIICKSFGDSSEASCSNANCSTPVVSVREIPHYGLEYMMTYCSTPGNAEIPSSECKTEPDMLNMQINNSKMVSEEFVQMKENVNNVIPKREPLGDSTDASCSSSFSNTDSSTFRCQSPVGPDQESRGQGLEFKMASCSTPKNAEIQSSECKTDPGMLNMQINDSKMVSEEFVQMEENVNNVIPKREPLGDSTDASCSSSFSNNDSSTFRCQSPVGPDQESRGQGQEFNIASCSTPKNAEIQSSECKSEPDMLNMQINDSRLVSEEFVQMEENVNNVIPRREPLGDSTDTSCSSSFSNTDSSTFRCQSPDGSDQESRCQGLEFNIASCSNPKNAEIQSSECKTEPDMLNMQINDSRLVSEEFVQMEENVNNVIPRREPLGDSTDASSSSSFSNTDSSTFRCQSPDGSDQESRCQGLEFNIASCSNPKNAEIQSSECKTEPDMLNMQINDSRLVSEEFVQMEENVNNVIPRREPLGDSTDASSSSSFSNTDSSTFRCQSPDGSDQESRCQGLEFNIASCSNPKNAEIQSSVCKTEPDMLNMQINDSRLVSEEFVQMEENVNNVIPRREPLGDSTDASSSSSFSNTDSSTFRCQSPDGSDQESRGQGQEFNMASCSTPINAEIPSSEGTPVPGMLGMQIYDSRWVSEKFVQIEELHLSLGDSSDASCTSSLSYTTNCSTSRCSKSHVQGLEVMILPGHSREDADIQCSSQEIADIPSSNGITMPATKLNNPELNDILSKFYEQANEEAKEEVMKEVTHDKITALVPCIYGDNIFFTSEMFTFFEKRQVIAALEITLSMFPDKNKIIRKYLAIMFYYPGIRVLKIHLSEIEKKLVGLGNSAVVERFNYCLRQFIRREELSLASWNGVFTIRCKKCEDLYIGVSPADIGSEIKRILELNELRTDRCTSGGTGHRYEENTLRILGASGNMVVSRCMYELERLKLIKLKIVAPLPGEVVEVSREWWRVWSMRYSRIYFYGWYKWYMDHYRRTMKAKLKDQIRELQISKILPRPGEPDYEAGETDSDSDEEMERGRGASRYIDRDRPEFEGMRQGFHGNIPEFNGVRPAFPGYQQAFPGYQQAFPGYQQAFPGHQQAFPGYQQAFPGHQQAFPGHQQAFPGHQQAFPGHQQAFPGHQQAFPGHQQAFPGYQQAFPGHQPAFPGYRSAFPGYWPGFQGYSQGNDGSRRDLDGNRQEFDSGEEENMEEDPEKENETEVDAASTMEYSNECLSPQEVNPYEHNPENPHSNH